MRLGAAVRWAFVEVGPLIVFWALALTLGVKPAIAGSLAFILADAAWRSCKRLASVINGERARLKLMTNEGSAPSSTCQFDLIVNNVG